MASGYRHGVYVTEKATDLQVLSRQDGGLIMVVGTSPIRNAANPALANEPVLCGSYSEAVSRLGYSSDTGSYTLCEAMDVLFGLYQVAPIVFVNVFDPSVHKTDVTREQNLVTATHTVELSGDVMADSIVVETKAEIEDDEVWTIVPPVSKEYTLEKTVITLGESFNMGAQVYVSYAKPDVSKVTAMYVSGTVNATTGKCTGLELVSEIYSRFGQTVGTLIAPGWSQLSEVGIKLGAKAELINGHFSAVGIADLPTALIGGYSEAPNIKNTYGYTSPHLIACYPAVKYGGLVQHLSTHLAGRMALQTAEDDDIPYRSPSNREALISGMCNLDGSDNYFGEDAARYLNGQGIVTVTNFDGWKFWGNRTSAYPSNSDPKDCWISVRRMFNYIKAALVSNFWSELDEPIIKREVDSVVNSANTFLNGLTSRGAILGGRVEFLEEDNGEADLADGQATFRVYVTPPSPMREIVFTMEYDSTYLTNIFE